MMRLEAVYEHVKQTENYEPVDQWRELQTTPRGMLGELARAGRIRWDGRMWKTVADAQQSNQPLQWRLGERS